MQNPLRRSVTPIRAATIARKSYTMRLPPRDVTPVLVKWATPLKIRKPPSMILAAKMTVSI
jgi:hypothetical protein